MFSVSLLLLLSLATLCFGQDLKCASSSRYHIPTVTGNWFQATEYCNSIGMRLAVITNAQDNANVVALVKSNPQCNPGTWIGGNDLGKEGNFYWQPTGAKFSYAQWEQNPKQPDNDKKTEHCVEIRTDYKYNWNDRDCAVAQCFVCENVEPNRVVVLF